VSFQQFDALCKAEVAFFISRAILNVSKEVYSAYIHIYEYTSIKVKGKAIPVTGHEGP
jgi:hypothetical protein